MIIFLGMIDSQIKQPKLRPVTPLIKKPYLYTSYINF